MPKRGRPITSTVRQKFLNETCNIHDAETQDEEEPEEEPADPPDDAKPEETHEPEQTPEKNEE